MGVITAATVLTASAIGAAGAVGGAAISAHQQKQAAKGARNEARRIGRSNIYA